TGHALQRHRALLALGLAIALPSGLMAQWSVAFEATASYYDGASRHTAADPISVRPHHPTSFGLRLERCFGQVGVGISAALAGPDVIAENSSAGAIVKDALDLFEISARSRGSRGPDAVGRGRAFPRRPPD